MHEDAEDLVDAIEAIKDALAGDDACAADGDGQPGRPALLPGIVSMERCPGCRARLTGSPVCPRCGCDLALVRRAEMQARNLMRHALRAWVEGDRQEAKACAAASLALESSRLGQVVLKGVSAEV